MSNVFRDLWEWFLHGMEKCELCNINPYTHVELCTEGGIRVCDECAAPEDPPPKLKSA